MKLCAVDLLGCLAGWLGISAAAIMSGEISKTDLYWLMHWMKDDTRLSLGDMQLRDLSGPLNITHRCCADDLGLRQWE